MEHRWGERLKVALPVRIHAACGLVGAGLVVNFSVSGAFIATTLPVALLSQVRVSFTAGGHHARRIMRTTDSSFEGQVVRQNAAGFAVEWSEFGTDEVVAFANSNRSRLGIPQRLPAGAPMSNLARLE
jgi:PilZ domain